MFRRRVPMKTTMYFKCKMTERTKFWFIFLYFKSLKDNNKR